MTEKDRFDKIAEHLLENISLGEKQYNILWLRIAKELKRVAVTQNNNESQKAVIKVLELRDQIAELKKASCGRCRALDLVIAEKDKEIGELIEKAANFEMDLFSANKLIKTLTETIEAYEKVK